MVEEKTIASSAFEVAQLMTEKKMQFRPGLCFDNAYLIPGKRDFKLLEKKSSSDSQSFFGDIKIRIDDSKYTIPVALKMFLHLKGFPLNVQKSILTNFESLQYEAEVYKFIFDNIIAKNYSPNFISYIGYGCCSYDNVNEFIRSDPLKQAIGFLIETIDKKTGTVNNFNLENKICMLITEKAGIGKQFKTEDATNVDSLYYFWKEISYNSKLKILFQIIYSVACMNLFRINHNDFHTENILVAKFKNPILLSFNVEGEIFQFETRYIPYLFDWDFAYTSLLGRENTKIIEFNDINIFHNFHPCKDLYTLFCYLKFKDPIANEYIQPEIKNTIEKTKINITHEQAKNITKYFLTFSISQKENKDTKEYYEIPVYKVKLTDLTGELIKIRDEKLETLNQQSFIYFELYYDYIKFWEGYECRWSTVNKESLPLPIDLLKQKFNDFKVENRNPNSFYYVLPTLETIGEDMRDRIKKAVRDIEPVHFDDIPYEKLISEQYKKDLYYSKPMTSRIYDWFSGKK
jgi:hypothetical protein